MSLGGLAKGPGGVLSAKMYGAGRSLLGDKGYPHDYWPAILGTLETEDKQELEWTNETSGERERKEA